MKLTQLNKTQANQVNRPNSRNYFHMSERTHVSRHSCLLRHGQHWEKGTHRSRTKFRRPGTATRKIYTACQWVRCQFFLSAVTPAHVILQAVLKAKRRRVDVLQLGESVSIVLCRIAKQHPSEETQIESDRRPFKCWGQAFRIVFTVLSRFCKWIASSKTIYDLWGGHLLWLGEVVQKLQMSTSQSHSSI